MNVLRGGPVTETAEAHRALGAPVVNGGLVVEGSCDTDGQVTVAHLLRKRGGELHREGLLFHTTFERGFSPWLFRDWLPSDLRRTTTPGTPMFELLRLWHARFETTLGPLQNRFVESLADLPQLTLWEPGGARWAPLGGVPRSKESP